MQTMGDQETFVPKAFFRLGRYLSEVSNVGLEVCVLVLSSLSTSCLFVC